MKSDLAIWLLAHPGWVAGLVLGGATVGVFVMALLAVTGDVPECPTCAPRDRTTTGVDLV